MWRLLPLVWATHAQLLPGCPPREVMPFELQGFGYVRRPAAGAAGRGGDFVGNYSVLGNAIEHYGPSFLKGTRLGNAAITGVLSTACIASATKEPVTGFYDIIFSREDITDSPTKFCMILSVALEPGSSTMNDVRADYHNMVRLECCARDGDQ